MTKINENSYYIIDASFTIGKVVGSKHDGKNVKAERTLFHLIEEEFSTMREAKKKMESMNWKTVERKIEKYTVTTTGRIISEKGKSFGWGIDTEYTVEVNKERTGFTVMDGFSLIKYFGKDWGFTK